MTVLTCQLWNVEVRMSAMSLKHAALGLLALRGDASGYDLLQIFDGSLAYVWPATQSQLYTELNKLAEAELVTVSAEGGRGRKAYAVTEAGQAEFRHWMTEVAPASRRRNDMLLRVFFLSLLTPEQAREYLRRQAEDSAEHHEQLRGLEKELAQDRDSLAGYGRLALEWGLRFTAMQREWAQWAVGQVDSMDEEPEDPAASQ